jgi:hypothetical protein
MRFFASFLLWLVWLVVAAIGLFLTPIMLLCGWQGYSTWWGNRLYGKAGNSHIGNKWYSSWVFLAIRNPVSNFGKYVLGVSPNNKWAWLIDARFCLYGWAATPDPRDNSRKFYFRLKLNKGK